MEMPPITSRSTRTVCFHRNMIFIFIKFLGVSLSYWWIVHLNKKIFDELDKVCFGFPTMGVA